MQMVITMMDNGRMMILMAKVCSSIALEINIVVFGKKDFKMVNAKMSFKMDLNSLENIAWAKRLKEKPHMKTDLLTKDNGNKASFKEMELTDGPVQRLSTKVNT